MPGGLLRDLRERKEWAEQFPPFLEGVALPPALRETHRPGHRLFRGKERPARDAGLRLVHLIGYRRTELRRIAPGLFDPVSSGREEALQLVWVAAGEFGHEEVERHGFEEKAGLHWFARRLVPLLDHLHKRL